MQLNYYSLARGICRESYFEFFKMFWPVISPEPLVLNWHVEYLCNEIQHHMERVFKRQTKECDLIVNISPGTSKSSIFSVLLQPWCWTRMPGLRKIGCSYQEELAFELTVKSRRVVQSPLYSRLFPEIELRKDLNAKSLWSNTLGGDRYAIGMGGGIMGKHGHLIVLDDPLNPREGRSEAAINTAREFCTESLPSRLIHTENDASFMMLVMQRICIDDPTGLWLQRSGVKQICLPAELTDDVKPENLRDNYVDGLFSPTLLPRAKLCKKLEELGQYGYSGQFLQSPIPLGGGMFKVDKLEEHYAYPGDECFTRIARFWDRAASDGKGDWTVGVKMGLHKDGSYWILDVVRGQWSSDTREKIMQETAARDGKRVRIGFEQEPGSSGIDSAKETIRRLSGYLIEGFRATGSKEVRADTFSVQVNAGNVKVLKGKWLSDYKYELAHFPNAKHDDQVDASSGAFSMLINKKVKLGVLR